MPRVAKISAITYALLIVSIAQTSAQADKETFDPELICSLVANGTKIKDPRYCNVYVECVDNTTVTGSCGAQFYDLKTATCADPATVKCLSSDPCAGKPTGFVSDPYSCNGYYYCNNGASARGECSQGMNYNPETQNCIRNYPCEITMYPGDYCNIVPEGVFIKDATSCQGYQTCWDWTLLNGTCPNGFYFNAFRGDCDLPQNVDCQNHTPEPEIPADVRCTENGVFISDGRTCNGYYYCMAKANGDFNLIYGTCPVDRFFTSQNGGECVIRTNLTCDYNRCVTLGLNYIQMANIAGDGCTGFLLCQNQEEIGRAECPSGLYFDEMSQLCVDEPVTYAACAVATSTTTTTMTSLVTNETTDAEPSASTSNTPSTTTLPTDISTNPSMNATSTATVAK